MTKNVETRQANVTADGIIIPKLEAVVKCTTDTETDLGLVKVMIGRLQF
jgi:hypothetical protein